ncbi:hypothetical protein [Lunatibacter salilacus]|uniref:hypothetical protein n=1 Tax=Lunatibacter salilacus TaxID=2483804 RepID=UPI00131EB17A|nr:hypothetical protein [Lunatibacter salilacus]
MKSSIKLILLCLLMSGIGCTRDEEPNNSGVFQVTVVGKGIDCGSLLVIDFEQDDQSGIDVITGTSEWLRFYAYNLDMKYNQPGKILKVTARKTKDEELSPCTHLGPTYPWITILNVEE